MTPVSRLAARFLDDRRGSMVVEFVLIMPILIWAYLSLYTFWDAYRSGNTIQKQAYTVADLISREQKPVNAAYINGMRLTLDSLIGDRGDPVQLRVTSVVYSSSAKKFNVEWSQTSGTTKPAWTTSELNLKVGTKIPKMGDGDTAVIVEAWVPYVPPMASGVKNVTFSEFVVTRPRFAPRIVYQ